MPVPSARRVLNGIREPFVILPTTPENYPDRIPEFAFEDEAREFWETHDSSPYWDQMEDVTDSPPASLAVGPGRQGSTARRRPGAQRMELVSLRFPTEMLERVRIVAERRHLPYQTMIRSWVAERLDEEQNALTRDQQA